MKKRRSLFDTVYLDYTRDRLWRVNLDLEMTRETLRGQSLIIDDLTTAIVDVLSEADIEIDDQTRDKMKTAMSGTLRDNDSQIINIPVID